MTATEFNEKIVLETKRLKSFALKLTNDVSNADDLLSDTILKAATKRESFVSGGNFKGWLNTIMYNSFINTYRRDQRILTHSDHLMQQYMVDNLSNTSFSSPDSILHQKEIQKSINALSEKTKKPFNLYLEGHKYEEIATILKIPIGTVKGRIFHARQKLMDHLKDYRN